MSRDQVACSRDTPIPDTTWLPETCSDEHLVLPSIGGHYDRPFWESWLLKLSYEHSVIQHALAAVGSLHESLTWLSVESPTRADAQEPYALQQYNKAIRLLTSQDASELPVHVVLTTCILFVAFENLCNHPEDAMKHLRNGWHVLENWQPRTQTEKELMEKCLTPIFALGNAHIAVNIEYNGHDALSPDPSREHLRWGDLPNLPSAFTSLDHARDVLQDTLDRVFPVLEMLTSTSDGDTLSVAISRTLQLLQEWLTRFEDLSECLPKQRESHGLTRASILLRLQYHIGCMLSATGPYADETLFDAHLDHFREIVALCRSYVKLASVRSWRAKPSKTFSFGFDIGIIPPLFITVCRCRDPGIRREALRILRESNRLEGPWFSGVAATIAEQTMLIEETGLKSIRSCADVPHTNRVRTIAGHYDPGRFADSKM